MSLPFLDAISTLLRLGLVLVCTDLFIGYAYLAWRRPTLSVVAISGLGLSLGWNFLTALNAHTLHGEHVINSVVGLGGTMVFLALLDANLVRVRCQFTARRMAGAAGRRVVVVAGLGCLMVYLARDVL